MDSPDSLLASKHLMKGELSVQIFPDVVNPSRVSLLLHQPGVKVSVLLHQQSAATQELPGARSHGGWDSLATTAADLAVTFPHEVLPLTQHVQPFLLPAENHLRPQATTETNEKEDVRIQSHGVPVVIIGLLNWALFYELKN